VEEELLQYAYGLLSIPEKKFEETYDKQLKIGRDALDVRVLVVFGDDTCYLFIIIFFFFLFFFIIIIFFIFWYYLLKILFFLIFYKKFLIFGVRIIARTNRCFISTKHGAVSNVYGLN
jgi:hypothetical protein